MNRRFAMLAAWPTLMGAALVGCGSSNSPGTGSSSSSGSACSITNTSSTDGGGASLKIGSKDFTEEKLLATLTKLELQKHNFTIDYTTKAADKAIGQALQNNQIQMLWQYTGTELGTYLNVDNVPTDLDQAFSQAQQLDAAKGLCWTSKAPFDDTNGIAIRQADASKFGNTLSSVTAYIQQHNDVKVCIMSEFRSRPDGLLGLNRVYGGVWGSYAGLSDITTSGEAALANKQCDAAEVFTTDAGISANNLVALQDDKKLFPPDNVGLMVRSDVLSAHPAIVNVMAPIAAKLTTDEMTLLNKQVDIDGRTVDDVAGAFLSQNGF